MDDDKTRLPEDFEPSESSHQFEPGADFGPYRIIRLLGRGGMGEVYEAEHRDLHTRHALKLINPEIVDRSDAKERFKREARVMARLRHPHIVHVDDFGELDGRIWLRMDLMGGWRHQGKTYHSLQDLMREKGALPESLVRRLLGEILDGLGFAHEAGAVHRDLKPANLLLDEEGRVKITDFGLVSLAGADWLQSQVQLTVARSMADPDATRLEMEGSSAGTSTQALLGTYAYMSPEQKKGSDVDARSDLFAVGLIGFQMLTGEEKPVFEMPSDLVEEIDPGWDDWVRQSLASRADRRFGDAGHMKENMPGQDKPAAEEERASTFDDEPPRTPMDQEFTKLEERLAEQSAPPPVPDFEGEPEATATAYQSEEDSSPVQQLGDAALKKAYSASRSISAFAVLVMIFSALFALSGLIVVADGDSEGWAFILMAVPGFLYWHWSKKRAAWHKTALIIFNALSLLSFNLLSGLMLYYLCSDNNLFGPNRFKPQDLNAELKRRSLSAGLSGIMVFFIVLIVLFFLIALANA